MAVEKNRYVHVNTFMKSNRSGDWIYVNLTYLHINNTTWYIAYQMKNATVTVRLEISFRNLSSDQVTEL